MWFWLLQTDSLDLTGAKRQGLFFAALVMLVNVSVSVWAALKFRRLAQLIEKKTPKNILSALLFLLFSLADFVIAWGLALLWVGPQARWDSVLPIGSSALVLLNTPVIFASRFIGLYGLAGFTWLIIYMLYQRKLRKLVWQPLLLVALASVVGWQAFKTPNGTQFKAVLVSETLAERVSQIKPTNEQLVVFPEYGLEKATNENLKERIEWGNKDKTKTFFTGSTQIYQETRRGHENRLLVGNTHDGLTDYQDKFRLIPGGEDAPYLMRTFLRATGQKGALDFFTISKSVIRGSRQLEPFQVSDNIRVGIAVCSSIIAPQDYRHLANSGANVFANAASLRPFNGSRLFAWQQKSFGRFMAVANSRYFLQSANSASAYAFDNNGKKQAEVRGVNTISVLAKTNSKRTPYMLLGDWPVWLGSVLVVGWFGKLVLAKVNKGRNGKSKKEK